MQPIRTSIDVTSLGVWAVEAGEGLRPFQHKNEISGYVFEVLRSQPQGRILVVEDVGARSWISRLLFRMNPRVLRMHFAVEWSGTAASIMFFDDAGGVYSAQDKDHHIYPDEATRKAIAHGELSPHPIDECLALERALRALDEYLKSGSRPTWLDYHYVA